MAHGTDDRRASGVTETAPGGAAPAFKVRPFEVRGGVPMLNVIAAASVALAALIALVGTGTFSASPPPRTAAVQLGPWAKAAAIERPPVRPGTAAQEHARAAAAAERHRVLRFRAVHRRAANRRAARHRAAAHRRTASTSAAASRHATGAPARTSSPVQRPAAAPASTTSSPTPSRPSTGSSHSSGGGGGGSSGGGCREYALC
jgi:hypothetical protein